MIYVGFKIQMYTYINTFARELLEHNKNKELLKKDEER